MATTSTCPSSTALTLPKSPAERDHLRPTPTVKRSVSASTASTSASASSRLSAAPSFAFTAHSCGGTPSSTSPPRPQSHNASKHPHTPTPSPRRSLSPPPAPPSTMTRQRSAPTPHPPRPDHHRAASTSAATESLRGWLATVEPALAEPKAEGEPAAADEEEVLDEVEEEGARPESESAQGKRKELWESGRAVGGDQRRMRRTLSSCGLSLGADDACSSSSSSDDEDSLPAHRLRPRTPKSPTSPRRQSLISNLASLLPTPAPSSPSRARSPKPHPGSPRRPSTPRYAHPSARRTVSTPATRPPTPRSPAPTLHQPEPFDPVRASRLLARQTGLVCFDTLLEPPKEPGEQQGGKWRWLGW